MSVISVEVPPPWCRCCLVEPCEELEEGELLLAGEAGVPGRSKGEWAREEGDPPNAAAASAPEGLLFLSDAEGHTSIASGL